MANLIDKAAQTRTERPTAGSPTVSIGLPVFNGERYLERAVRSILDQGFADLELIIVDNASDDGTAAIAERMVAADQRVRYHRNPENIGAALNFCRAFELARGRYFKWAAYDDWLEPSFLTRCVEVLDREPETVLVFPSTNVYDESGELLRRYQHPDGLTSGPIADRFFEALWNWKYATAVFGLMRTDLLAQTSLIQPYVSSDRVMFLELVLLGDIREIDEYLFNSTETASVRKGRGITWWAARTKTRPTCDHWRLLADYLVLVARTPRFGLVDRVKMTGAVLAFFCRRWPRQALYGEVLENVAYAGNRLVKVVKR